MKKNSTITMVICGLAAIFATVVFYLLAFDNIFTIPMRWLSMTALLIVEVIGTAKALITTKNILGIAQIVTGILHLIATLVISIIFVNLFPFLIKAYVLINTLIFIIVAVVDVLLFYFNEKSEATGAKYASSASVIDMCETMVKQLWIEHMDTAYAAELKALTEMLTYANRAMASPTDGELLSNVEELGVLISNNESEQAINLMQKIHNMLKIRIDITKKTGKF